jgi:hypothetical protein
MKRVYILIVFLFFNFQSISQKIENVDFNVVGTSIVVYYDLVNCHEGTKYFISLQIRKASGELIYPHSIYGDTYKVSPGRKKSITWNVLSDGIELHEEIKPIVIVDGIDNIENKYNPNVEGKLSENHQVRKYKETNIHNISSNSSYKQGRKNKVDTCTTLIAVDIGGGINNKQGILGMGLGFNISPYIAITGGVGAGSWGNIAKYYSEMRLSLSNRYVHKNSYAIGMGITYYPGAWLEDSINDNSYRYYVYPQRNYFICLYNMTNILYDDGFRRGGRFYYNIGWSFRHSSKTISIVNLTPEQIAKKKIAPGGFIIAVGWLL